VRQAQRVVLAAAVLVGERGELGELVGLEPADRDDDADRAVRAVGLGEDADVVLAREARGLRDAVAQVAADALDDLRAQGLRADPVDEELQPRLAARLPVVVGVAEDAGDRGDDLGGLLGGDEDVDPAGEARLGGQAAADAQVEAARAVGLDRRRERDVVDQPARAVLRAAGDADLVLARQVRVELVVQEVLVDRLGGRVAVDDLVVREPGHGAPDDVAGDVAAGAGGRHPDPLEAVEDLRDVLQPDPVDLEALARRAVDHAAAEVLGDRGHGLDLRRAQLALDHLDAHHEMPVAGVVRVEAVPLEEPDVVGAQRFPAVLRSSEEFGEYVEAVRLRLDAFDLAHGVRWTVARERSNHKESRSGFTYIYSDRFRRVYTGLGDFAW
jgi:hypothetical protein